MLTPKEKAEDLLLTYSILEDGQNHLVKKCALKAVDEVFEFMKMDDEYTGTASNANSKWVNYWEEVKKEIQEQ